MSIISYSTWMGLARIAFNNRRYELVTFYTSEAIRNARSAIQTFHALILGGDAKKGQNEFEDAKKLYTQALTLANDLDDKNLVANAQERAENCKSTS